MEKDSLPDVELNSSDTSLVKHFGIRFLLFAVLIGIVYVWRPFFHWIIYPMTHSVFGVFLFGLPALAAIILWFAPPLADNAGDSMMSKGMILGVVVVGGLIIGLAFAIPAGMYEDRTLAQETMDNAVEVDEFPEVNEENPRIAPRGVSDVQTDASVSYRQYQLGTSDIARMDDGRLSWSYPVEPEPFQVKLRGHQQGVLMYDMTSMENREMRAVDDHEFTYGEGMYLHRGTGGMFNWQIQKGDYWVQYNDDPVEFVHDGTPYMYYPKTTHEWRGPWTGDGMIPHTVPTWDGGALVHPDGTIEHLEPEEAQEHPVLDGQRLYPLTLTETEVSALDNRNGIWNQMPFFGTYEGVIEPASMPTATENEQPFVIDLEGEEMSYVMAMEPHGGDTAGLDEVWFTHAETGEMQYYATEEETITGPENALGIARGSDTRTDWGADGDAMMVEPIPMIVDGELWWHHKVVTADETDVVRNVFVNAHTEETVEIHDTEAVYEFISGEDVEDLEDAEDVETEPADEEDDISYWVVITDEDGEEIDRIPVEEGEEVNIVSDAEEDDENDE